MARRFIDTLVFKHRSVKLVSQGLRKVIGKYELAKVSPYRSECTPQLFKEILPNWRLNTVGQRNALCATKLALDKLLRLGAILKTKHNKGRVPTLKHLDFESDCFYLTLKLKQDKWFQGTRLQFKKNRNDATLCTVKAMKQCLKDSHTKLDQEKPLFCDEHGDALTSNFVIEELHYALKKSGFSTQGVTSKVYRRGGAQEAYSAGGEKLVKELGRWASDSWKTYVQKDIYDKRNYKQGYEEMLTSIIYLVETSSTSI